MTFLKSWSAAALLGAILWFSPHAHAQTLINCAPGVACPGGVPGANAGDQAFTINSKINANLIAAWAWHPTCTQPLACGGTFASNPTWSIGGYTSTGSSASRTLQDRAADTANIADFGAVGDTVRIQAKDSNANVTCTAGSPVFTVQVSLPSSYIGTKAVIGGCGPWQVNSNPGSGPAVAAGGTLYSASPAPSGNPGSDVVLAVGGTCTVQPAFKVLTVAAGVVTNVGVVNPGSCTTFPSNPISTTAIGTAVPFKTTEARFSFSATSGSVTVTSVPGGVQPFVNDGTDVGRVIRVFDSTGYHTATITATSSRSSATATISGTLGQTTQYYPWQTWITPTGGTTGTGLTINANWLGSSLPGNITAVGTNQLTLDTNAAISNGGPTKAYWWAGHDDTAGWTGAIATGAHTITCPAPRHASWNSAVYVEFGQYTSIQLPTNHRIVIECPGNGLNALAPMAAQFYTLDNGSDYFNDEGSGWHHFRLDGAGVAQVGFDHQMTRWRINSSIFRNHTFADVFYETLNSSNNAQDNVLDGNNFTADNLVVPSGPYYNLYIQAGNTDNMTLNSAASRAMLANINGSGGGHYINNHVFSAWSGPNFLGQGGNHYDTANVADGPSPGQAGHLVNGNKADVLAWSCNMNNAAYAGQYCVYVANDGFNEIGVGNGGDDVTWAGNYANIVAQGAGFTTNTIDPFSSRVQNASPAPTATALAVTPSQCTAGQFSTGIAANGNSNCSPVTASVVCASGVPVTHTGTTGEQNFATCSVAAHTMGANGTLRIIEEWTATNNVNAKTLVTRLAGTSGAVTGGAVIQNISMASAQSAQCQVYLHNAGAENSQVQFSNNNCTGLGNGAGVPPTSSQDTGNIVYVNFNYNETNAGDSATLLYYSVEAIPHS